MCTPEIYLESCQVPRLHMSCRVNYFSTLLYVTEWPFRELSQNGKYGWKKQIENIALKPFYSAQLLKQAIRPMLKYSLKHILTYSLAALALASCNNEHHHDKGKQAGSSPSVKSNDTICNQSNIEPYIGSGWVRPIRKGQTITAAYMTICNPGDEPIIITSVASPLASSAELHLSSRDEDGRTSMQPVSELRVPAHQHALLEQGGYHIMLFGLTNIGSENESVPITILLKNGNNVKAELPFSGPQGPNTHGTNPKGSITHDDNQHAHH